MRAITCSLITAFMFAACSFFDQGGDMKKDKSGNWIFLDTKRNWSELVFDLDVSIRSEKNGWPAPSGQKNWTEFWLYRFETFERLNVNPCRPVRYVIEMRRKEELPELPRIECGQGTREAE